MANKGDRKGDTTNEHRGKREQELKPSAVDRAQGLRECEISLRSNWNDKKETFYQLANHESPRHIAYCRENLKKEQIVKSNARVISYLDGCCSLS